MEVESQEEAREITDDWINEYNTIKPHGSLNLMMSVEFLAQQLNQFVIPPKKHWRVK